ncbi:MAG TPA: AAA family ATPase [Thermoleophilaceae bacterium]
MADSYAVTGPETLLERSADLDLLNEALADVRANGRGQLLLVAGEAGIGKTTLTEAFVSGLGPVRVLSGACEALNTPRPLGPLVDIAADTGGELAAAVEAGASPSDVLAALLGELGRRSPSVVVLEDLHWADEATLDVLRLLARRLATAPALVLATCRDELDSRHPLRIVLGELPQGSVKRVSLQPLSLSAVATLAEPHGVDPEELHDRTAGNPLYVTEALAAGGAALPDSVRDAVLARAARLDTGARALLDAAAIVPPRAELWLLEALADDGLAHLDQCIASGMLRAERGAVAFRHEVVRVAIEEALAPDRRLALHRRALPALATALHGQADPARMAHHAEAAGDAAAVLRYAPVAGERAARLGAHREAAAQYARALRCAAALPGEERAELLERRAYECYLTDAIDDAASARHEALAIYRERGDRLRAGDTHRWLSRLAWFNGDNAVAEAEAAKAVELLEGLPPGPELAMAYSNMSQLRMLASDPPATLEWGRRAIELAEELGQTEILVHALNNVGTAERNGGALDEGLEKLERSLRLALDAGLDEHVARAYTNLSCTSLEAHEYALADGYLDAGIDYCRERDLDSWRMYMIGWTARSQLEQGRWEQAGSAATAVLSNPNVATTSRITPLIVLGQLRARRGDPDVWAPLDEARELARATMEAQRVLPSAAARAEARWLAGEVDQVAGETGEALEVAAASEHSWGADEIRAWRRRAGIDDHAAPESGPFRLEAAGEPEQAAEAWRALGRPYEAALALLESDDEEALRTSLAEFQRLGARPAAARAARALRERGARDVRRGPRASTRDNPAGLTGRELEVLELLADGMRNAQIAERLVLSRKTVDHHVSAILRKLGTATRTEAAAEAARLGILER